MHMHVPFVLNDTSTRYRCRLTTLMSSYRDGQKGGPVLLSNSQTVPGKFFCNQWTTPYPISVLWKEATGMGYTGFMQRRGVFKKCIFSTCSNFTILYMRHLVINSCVSYL